MVGVRKSASEKVTKSFIESLGVGGHGWKGTCGPGAHGAPPSPAALSGQSAGVSLAKSKC